MRSSLLSPRNLAGGRKPRTNQSRDSHTQTGKPLLLLSLLNQLNPPLLSYPNTTATSTPFSASLTFTFFTILLFVALQKRYSTLIPCVPLRSLHFWNTLHTQSCHSFLLTKTRRHFSSVLLHYTPVTSSELPRPLLKPHPVRSLRFG